MPPPDHSAFEQYPYSAQDTPTARRNRPTWKKVALATATGITAIGLVATSTFVVLSRLADDGKPAGYAAPTDAASPVDKEASDTPVAESTDPTDSGDPEVEPSEEREETKFADPYDGLSDDSLEAAVKSDLGCVDIGIGFYPGRSNFEYATFNCFYDEPEPMDSVGDVEGIYIPTGENEDKLREWLDDHDSPWECDAASHVSLCAIDGDNLARAVAGRPEL